MKKGDKLVFKRAGLRVFPKMKGKQAVFVSNHPQEKDWICITRYAHVSGDKPKLQKVDEVWHKDYWEKA